jgi:hypothetical protein
MSRIPVPPGAAGPHTGPGVRASVTATTSPAGTGSSPGGMTATTSGLTTAQVREVCDLVDAAGCAVLMALLAVLCPPPSPPPPPPA